MEQSGGGFELYDTWDPFNSDNWEVCPSDWEDWLVTRAVDALEVIRRYLRVDFWD